MPASAARRSRCRARGASTDAGVRRDRGARSSCASARVSRPRRCALPTPRLPHARRPPRRRRTRVAPDRVRRRCSPPPAVLLVAAGVALVGAPASAAPRAAARAAVRPARPRAPAPARVGDAARPPDRRRAAGLLARLLASRRAEALCRGRARASPGRAAPTRAARRARRSPTGAASRRRRRVSAPLDPARDCALRAALAGGAPRLRLVLAVRARRAWRPSRSSRRLSLRRRRVAVLPALASGIVVLDVSASISSDTYARIARDARPARVSSGGRVRARALLGHRVPGAPAGHAGAGAAAVRALLRRPAADGARRAPARCRGAPGRTPSAPARGSRTGLTLALDVIRRDAARATGRPARQRPRHDSGDLERVTQRRLAYRRAGIPLHVDRAQPRARGRARSSAGCSRSDGVTRAAPLPGRASGARRRGARPCSLVIAGRRRRACSSPRSSRCDRAAALDERAHDRLRSSSPRSCSRRSPRLSPRSRTIVRSWDHALDGGDARFADRAAAARWGADIAASRRSRARRCSALDDDLALRRAVQAFVSPRRRRAGFDNGAARARVRATAELALADVAATSRPSSLHAEKPARRPRRDRRAARADAAATEERSRRSVRGRDPRRSRRTSTPSTTSSCCSGGSVSSGRARGPAAAPALGARRPPRRRRRARRVGVLS